MKKLAIIGASYLQLPLIEKAKKRGIETHVFAWAAEDVGEKAADYFYPYSIVEKETILNKCIEIGIDGICSIASDLAVCTVNYVAANMGLIGNSLDCTLKATNKNAMRRCFEDNKDPSPKSVAVECVKDLDGIELSYPIIVKPVDRSGSRGITRLDSPEGLEEAIEYAKEQGYIKKALVEEYAQGQEYSVEFISWKGKHHFLALTKKYTTGNPDYIETAHIEPADISGDKLEEVIRVVSHALTSLGVEYGASHSEIKISPQGNIKFIEIGARMGGDCIGSSLVELSTGFDFVNAVIDVALGIEPKLDMDIKKCAAIRFVFSEDDLHVLSNIKEECPEILIEEDINDITDHKVTDSSTRFGYYILQGENRSVIERYLPCINE